MMKKATILSFTIFVLQLASGGQSLADTVKTIDKLFAAWNDSTPGASLIIMRDESVLFNKSYGLADLEHGIRNTSETIFEAGSVSKQFTAAAILLLVKEGKISLTDDVRKYVPEVPSYGRTITIYHLLHHISGLKDWGAVASVGGWPRGTRVYTAAHVMEIVSRQHSLNFAPGERYSYSNTNYNLMVTIIERVSGKSFANFTQERIFQPLQMNSTQWRDDYREIIPMRAIGYGKVGKTYYTNMPFENVHGNGGLLTTSGDLLKWNAHWVNGMIGNANILDLQQEKGVLNNGTEIAYACGIFIQSRNAVREISHSGSTAGYRAWLAYYPGKKLSVVYLSNDGSVDPERVGDQLALILFGQSPAIKQDMNFSRVDREELEKKVGIYKNVNGFDITDIQLKDTVIALRNGPTLKPFTADSFYLGGNSRVIFKDKMLLVRIGKEINYYQKRDVPAMDATALAEYTGTYTSIDADVELKITVKDGKLQIFRRPDTNIPLAYSFRDGFYAFNNSILVEFTRKKNKISGFQLSTTRAENIPFVKIAETGKK